MQQLDSLNANLAALELAVTELKSRVDAVKAAAVDPAAVQAAADKAAAIQAQVAAIV